MEERRGDPGKERPRWVFMDHCNGSEHGVLGDVEDDSWPESVASDCVELSIRTAWEDWKH